MIARIWHGRVLEKDFEAYTSFLKEVAVPDYSNTAGFVKLTFLRRLEDSIGHFTLITYWKSLEEIKNFAGDDFEKAKYYPEDDNFLLEFEEKVVQHEVFTE